MTGEIVKRVVEYVSKEIVENPDEVIAEVRAAKGDMGRVIGRRGRVAKSIRVLAQAAADEEGLQARVEFID